MTPGSVTETDVLLVGMGPVGTALANALGRYGVRVLVIDQARELFTKPRAIALDNEALRILQMVGVSEGDFAKVAIPQVEYHSSLFGRFVRVNTAGIIDGHPMLVTFYQPELEAILRKRLGDYPSVRACLGMKLVSFEDQGPITAKLEDDEGRAFDVRARFLVGADGANSAVRRSLGLDFLGHTFQQDWLIVDALDVPNMIDHCKFFCNPARPTPQMVAPGGRQRWEFMLHRGENAQEMQRPESIRRLLAPWCDLDSIRIERTAVYRFHAREAQAFSKGNCFLVGDAAHVTPPFAGQGLVAGLRDIANLSWKLAWVLRGHADQTLLASYDQERRPHARKIINLARRLGSLVMPSNHLAAFVTHGLIRTARLLPAGRRLFDDLKIKPANTFDEGFFARHRRQERLRAGATFPQGWVRRSQSAAPMLSDDVLGLHWSLIGFGVDPVPLLPSALKERWEAMGGQVWQWCQRSQGQNLGEAERCLEGLDESLLPRRVPLDWSVIVRPDRCVYAEGPIEDVLAMVQEALSRIAPQDTKLGRPVAKEVAYAP
jgi:3-(3-hydroxy-phenyl)propionate hydroxylase